MTNTKLKPCPFCGTHLVLLTGNVWGHSSLMDRCPSPCPIVHCTVSVEPEDVNRWNTRARPTVDSRYREALEFKGTPGPWFVEGPNVDGSFLIESEGGGMVICAREKWPNRAPMSAANARLIAAAPELLEALEYMIDATQGIMWAYTEQGLQEDVCITKARAALTRALEGKPITPEIEAVVEAARIYEEKITREGSVGYKSSTEEARLIEAVRNLIKSD